MKPQVEKGPLPSNLICTVLVSIGITGLLVFIELIGELLSSNENYRNQDLFDLFFYLLVHSVIMVYFH